MANVKVAVRVRPLSERELLERGRSVVRIREDYVEVTNLKVPEHAEGDSRERVRRFAFDLCFDSSDPASPDYASQEMVYQRLGCEVLDALLSGYNACVLAYGQSGSGKTYTMAGGLDGDKKNGEALSLPSATRGLTPRICEGLFARLRAAAASSAPATDESPCARTPSSKDKAALRVKVSFLEIYKERVRDLLQPDEAVISSGRGAAPPFILRVREHPRHGPYVQGLSEHVVEDASSLAALVSRGEWARRVGSTAGNPRSSRGHALLAICPLTHHHATQHCSSPAPPRLHLVDLAGSERSGAATRSGAEDSPREEFAARLKEGASINRSLVTLGNVISALAERCSPPGGANLGDGGERDSALISSSSSSPSGATPTAISPTSSWTSSPSSSPRRSRKGAPLAPGGPSFFVPYRDSVLTWLLKDSLGGNSKTVMVAAVSPSSTCYNETISTLRYAQRTKCIVNSPVVNDEDPNARIIRELRDEVRKLRGMLLSVQMAESLQCRQPDGVTSLPDGEGDEDWTVKRRDSANEPFYLQGCQRDGEGSSEPPQGDQSDAADGTPTVSLTEQPPEGATRCAAMGREDSEASEATTVEEDMSTPPPGPVSLCFEDNSAARPTADSPADLPSVARRDSGGRAPLGPRPFGGSCELVYSANGHRVAESQGRPRGRSMSSGGIWSFRRQSSVDAGSSGGPSMRPAGHPDDASSSSVDSKGSGEGSSRGLKARNAQSAKAPPRTPPSEETATKGARGNRAFQVRTGVAEARRRAAEQARRRAEIVAAVTRRLYPTKRRLAAGAAAAALGDGGAGGGGEGGEEAAEGRTEAEGEAATEGGGGVGGEVDPGVVEAVSRARFRLLSRRALGAARKAPPLPPPRPVSYASAVTQTEGGEMREAGVGTEAPGEGLPLGPLARGILTRILIEGPPKPEDVLVDKWFSEDSLESSADSEDDESGDCENGSCGRLVSVSPGKWDAGASGAERRPSPRPLTDLFWECKNGGWGTWAGEGTACGAQEAAPESEKASADAEGDDPSDAARGEMGELQAESPPENAAKCITPVDRDQRLVSGKEKVREWQMNATPPDGFEEEANEAQHPENDPIAGATPTDPGEAIADAVQVAMSDSADDETHKVEEATEEEDDDSWGDSSCDDASESSADSDFLFLPPAPTIPAPRPPPIPARRQLYTITENSEHSDFSDAASLEALSRRSTPPSSLEHIREDWRTRGGGRGGGEGKAQSAEEVPGPASSPLPVIQVSEDQALKSPAEEVQKPEDSGSTAQADVEKESSFQRKDDGGMEERLSTSCSSREENVVKSSPDAVDNEATAVQREEQKTECDGCRARKRAPGCDSCGGAGGGGKVAVEDGRFLNVSILGRPQGSAVPVSIGMAEGGPLCWGPEGGPSTTASEDSITFVFVGRKKGGTKCAASLPPVLVELIRRSLGGEGRKRSWPTEQEGDEEGEGRRGRGRTGLRRCRRQGGAPLRRSVSVDTAVRALSRFVRMQGMRSCSGRPASTECLVPEEMGTILEQGRLHAVGEEGGGRGAEGGGRDLGGREAGGQGAEGAGRPSRSPTEGRDGNRAVDHGAAAEETAKGAKQPTHARSTKASADSEEGADCPERGGKAVLEGGEEEATGGAARDKGGGSSPVSPYLPPDSAVSHGGSRDAVAPKSPLRRPEECTIPSGAWVDAEEEEDEDDEFGEEECFPSLPRVTLGRTILRDADSKKMQLQEMRNVVFGFPEVTESRGPEERRGRRAGAKSVSWGDAGGGGGRRREGAESGGPPRPIIKRSTSLPIGGDAAFNEDVPSTADEAAKTTRWPADDRSPVRHPALSRVKSPRPDGSFAHCPAHGTATDKGRPRQTSDDQSDEDTSGEEFEERACRALSDFLVEATTLLEGFCRASGLSPDGERRKKKEEKRDAGITEGDETAESPLDAKEVLSALQSRLSDRHLMRSPPKNSRDTFEERNPISLSQYSPAHSNPVPSGNFTSTFESRLSSLYSSNPQREDKKLGGRSPRNCSQTLSPFQWSLPDDVDSPVSRVEDSAYGGEEEEVRSPEKLHSGTETKCKVRLYPDTQGTRASNTVSEFQQNEPSISEPFKARLSGFPLRNCSSVLLNSSPPESTGIKRSESECVVNTKIGTLNRPSSPDLFPDFGRPSGLSGRGLSSLGASLYSPSWSTGLPWREQDDSENRDNVLLQERAWRSSNALYVPSAQFPAPLRESQSDAAICSTKTSSSACCLHGHGHQETRVHHHHHHYHHYPPFVEPEYRQKWENMMKRLSWSEQDEEEDSLNLWRGSAPQLSLRNPPSLGTYDYVRAWQHDNLKGDLRGATSEFPRAEDTHTPCSSAPNSPYRSRQHSPPGSLPLSPSRVPRNHPPVPLRSNAFNPSQCSSPLSSQLGSQSLLTRSLSDSLPHHSLARPLNLPPPSHATPPQLRSPTRMTAAAAPSTSHLPTSPSHNSALPHSSPLSPLGGYHGPPYSAKFQVSSKTAYAPQPTSQYQSTAPSFPYRHSIVSPVHRPQVNEHSQAPPGSHHPLSLSTHSPHYVVPPTADPAWHSGNPQSVGGGLAPHAYLRHLVDVRKEVVAATRSCNPHLRSSTSHPT
ncbi:uncharacterized protein LOC124168410 [Ischnura elegans]|uniref:uncharacterized protein LOC124168410 n=1 Tax=Ischnura elegans TaxID=197161 RepID=UPI001ED89AAB|nr:uncharacterized protein LOC124168410 [Ischnura elegans]